MSRVWAALVAGLAAVGAAGGGERPAELAVPPEQLAKARDLVRQLGSPSYPAREDATAELARMGRSARAALLDAVATSTDYEVRSRAARLLPRAEAADLQARIAAFVADTDAKYDHDLPGWEPFREHAGGDKAARALFADMLRTTENRDLLAALATSRREGGIALSNRRTALFLAQNPGIFGRGIGPPVAQKQPTLTDIAAVVFGEIVVPTADIPRGLAQFGNITGAQFVQYPPSQQAATNPDSTPNGPAYRRLLLRWLDTRVSPEDLTQVVNVAQNLGAVRDMTPLLRKVVTTDGVQGTSRGQALVYLLQRNKKAEYPFLKAQLKNEVPVNPVFLGANPGGGAIQATCQVRDMALALLVADTGQNIHDYGFETAPGNAPNPVAQPYPTYAFLTDEARDRGLRKWAEWEAKHPIPPFDPAPAPKR